MIYEIALVKEDIFYELMDIIERYIDDLEDGHKRVVSGLHYMEKEMTTSLKENGKDVYMSDVNSTLNNAVDVLTTLEAKGVLSKEDAETFDDYCTKILEGVEIESSEHICVGKIIIAEDGYPYQISEIDYDDFSVNLWDGDEMSSGYWESPLNCRAKA
jgi:hypothetical protein